jgi:hypothetical protein
MQTMQAQTQKRYPLFAFFLLLLLAVGCGSDDEENGITPPPPLPTQNVLRLSNADGAAGTTDTLLLSLENVTDLSALQFDLTFDPAVLSVTGADSTVRSTGFETFVNSGFGTARVILMDLENTASIAIGNGSVAAVIVDVDAGAPLGASELQVENVRAVDTSSNTLSVGGSNATYTVR